MKRFAITAAVTGSLALAAFAATPPTPAEAVTNQVMNVSSGYRVAVRDSCHSSHSLAPGEKFNLSCSGNQVWINATDCVAIDPYGDPAHSYCAGSRGYWQSFRWSIGTTTLRRTN
jgi:hypothetical protein